MNPKPFFDFITERYKIFQKKEAGEPRPWTKDDILDYYRFTNVFREDDATTVWFRKNVRDSLRDSQYIILATVLFRWFNRMSTGEAIFCQKSLLDEGKTAWDIWKVDGTKTVLFDTIQHYIGWKGPHVTGAYIIKTPDGMTKLDGVIWAVTEFFNDRRELVYTKGGVKVKAMAGWLEGFHVMNDSTAEVTLEQAWDWLRKFHYLGDFMAYEIVTDLRFTCVLENAADINTWANAGPGAMRGLNRLHGRLLNHRPKKNDSNLEMQELLALSRDPENWPFVERPLEMREVEHMLCEFDKYKRVDNGEGKPRGVYK